MLSFVQIFPFVVADDVDVSVTGTDDEFQAAAPLAAIVVEDSTVEMDFG